MKNMNETAKQHLQGSSTPPGISPGRGDPADADGDQQTKAGR